MSFLLLQILLCLLIAGILGAIIGWYLRGGCSKILKDCEEEWEAKVRSLEEDWTVQLKQANDETEHFKHTMENRSKEQASLKTEVQNDFDPDVTFESKNLDKKKNSNSTLENMTAAILGSGNISESDNKDNLNIQEIRGIRSSDAKILNELGIRSTKDLRSLISDKEGIEKLSEKLNLPVNKISSWVSSADLLQIPGIDIENVELIQTTGISSARELAAVNIYSLYNKIMEFNQESPMVKDLPTVDTLKMWSEKAKKLIY